MSTTLNILDLIFLLFALIFIVVAFFRGFVKEIFSFLVWVVAFVASYLLTPLVSDLLKSYMTNKVVNDISTRSAIFILFFIGTTASVSKLSNELHDKTPVVFNRSLGVFYGMLKTLIISGIFYSIILNSLSFVSGARIDKTSTQFPSWLKDAKCHRIMEISGEIMNPITKKFFDSIAKNFEKIIPNQKDNLDQKIDKMIDDNNKEIEEEYLLETQENKDSGYSKKDIEKMNHLIEIIEK